MGINTNIWGAPETWVDSRNNSNLNNSDVKVGASGYSTYADQYSAERIPLNNIDISPCFWGISSESIWGSMYAAYCYAPDGLENPVEIGEKLVTESRENGSLPLMLIDSTMASPLQYGLGYGKRYTPVESNIMSDNVPYTRDIVLDFNYQKVICYPQLLVMTENHVTEYTALETYFNPNNSNFRDSHPYICAITYTMYLGAAGSRIGESSGIVPLIPYSFLGNNEQYESRYEFSGNGFSALKTSYITNDSNAGVILSCDNTGDEVTVNYNTPNATVATDDSGYRYRYCVNEPARDEYYPVPLYVHDDSGLWKYIRSSSTWWNVACVIDIRGKDIDELREYVLKQIAYLGFPFIVAYADRQKAIGETGVYLPVFDDNGVTTGEFSEGDAALEQRNAGWIDGRQSGYDPNRPPTPGGEDRGDLTNSYANRFTNAGGLSQYVVSEEEVIKLAAFLNGRYLPTAADLDADFKGTNPQQYVVSVQKYPFSLPNAGGTADIYVGQQNTGIEGKPLFATFGQIGVLPINNASTFDFGSIDLSDPEYMSGNFLDYQKKLLLYMPFVGTEELDPRLYFGHVLGLIYRIDYNTGAVAAEIKRDGLTMETKTGTISITVPFMAADMGSFQNQLAQLSYAKDLAKIKGAGTALSAGFTMAAGAQGTMSAGQPPLAALANLAQSGVQLAANATQLSQLDYQIEHTAPNVGTISTAAAANAFFMDARARLVVVFPSMLPGYNAQEYSHIIGNACCKTGNLGSFTGFTVCSTADLSGVTTKGSAARIPTEAEKELIRKVLLTGIYL